MGHLGIEEGEVGDAGLAGVDLDHHVPELHSAGDDALGVVGGGEAEVDGEGGTGGGTGGDGGDGGHGGGGGGGCGGVSYNVFAYGQGSVNLGTMIIDNTFVPGQGGTGGTGGPSIGNPGLLGAPGAAQATNF